MIITSIDRAPAPAVGLMPRSELQPIVNADSMLPGLSSQCVEMVTGWGPWIANDNAASTVVELPARQHGIGATV